MHHFYGRIDLRKKQHDALETTANTVLIRVARHHTSIAAMSAFCCSSNVVRARAAACSLKAALSSASLRLPSAAWRTRAAPRCCARRRARSRRSFKIAEKMHEPISFASSNNFTGYASRVESLSRNCGGQVTEYVLRVALLDHEFYF